MDNAIEYGPAVLYILGSILALVVAIAWIVFPFLLMSKVNRMLAAVERIQWIAEKSDAAKREREPTA